MQPLLVGLSWLGQPATMWRKFWNERPIIEQDITRISHSRPIRRFNSERPWLRRVVLSRAVRWHLDRRALCCANRTVVFHEKAVSETPALSDGGNSWHWHCVDASTGLTYKERCDRGRRIFMLNRSPNVPRRGPRFSKPTLSSILLAIWLRTGATTGPW